MRPLRLLLDGFGSYRQAADVDFSDVEFFALTGPTGSGKSTLIDGLCFALYGTVPRWGKENAIAHALAPAANACRVCLIFEAGGRRYAAVRALTRDKRGKVHTREARLELLSPDLAASDPLEELLASATSALAEGPDEVKARVQEILGLSYEHFTQSVLLPQGQFAEFLHAKPGDRQDLLVQLLAFGVYDTVGQRARERAKLAAAAADTARRERNELAFATPEAVTALSERVALLTRLESDVAGRLRELDEARRRAADTEQEVARLRSDMKLLADVAVPGPVPGLARRIADAEITAEQAAESLPDRSALENRLARYRDRRELAAQLIAQDAAAAKATDAEHAASGALHAAEEALRDATYALEQARDQHAAAHLASGLSPGADCPVCLRPVTDADLARRTAPASLDAAETAVAKAERQVRTAQDAARKATREAASARGAAAATRDRFIQAAAALATVAAPPRSMGKSVAIAAHSHIDPDAPDPADPAVDLSAAEAVAGEELARAEAADRALRSARAAAREARGVLDKAQRAREALTGEEEQAWTAFRRTRDALLAMNDTASTPGDAERHIHSAWAALAEWAAQRREAGELRLRELDERLGQRRRDLGAAEAEIVAMLAEAGVHTRVTDPMQVAASVAAERTRAEGNLETLRGQVQHAVVLDERIAAHREEEQVATLLGNLLRANAFERWLCGEALDTLVAEASQTLMELSGGQYQLDRDERNELVVIDYQDAAASRPVHTLSGGETFQASLALALALSRQVVGLSAGLRDLNSMFLDEGFGTLDEDTLETVAATLERLAADSDRMVGVITHVPALAERVPVRFVVSRDAGTSAIRKERAV